MSDKKLDQTINKGLQSAKDALAEKMIHLAHKDSVQTAAETVYNVTFTGIFTKDEKLVIAAMAKFFKQGQEATKRLLKAGRVVKSFTDKGPADKLAKMLSGIGLSCKVEMETIGGESDRERSTLLEKAAFKLADSKAPEVHIPKASQISWKQWLAVGVVISLLAGAGVGLWLKPPVVSGDSFASYQASVQKVIDRAPPEKRAAIRKAVDLLTGAGFQFHEQNTFGGSEAVAAGVVYAEVDGLNAEEILLAAEVDLEKRRQLYRQEVDSIKQQIATEEATIAELDKSNNVLKQLAVSEARFTWSQSTPEVMLRLTNNSELSISRIMFQGYLYDAKGKLLLSQHFAFGAATGIPPGGYKYVYITPSADSPWAVEEIRQSWQSTKFTATVENAVNTKGEEVGVDLRPNRKKVADLQERIRRHEKEMSGMKF